MLKLAISSSLQGYPEESSPGDPMDTRRLGIYIAGHLQAAFPQVQVELFNRDDFPGQGDNYIGLRDAVVRWGASIHVTIHQDAYRPQDRGWSILYYNPEALTLADELVSAMRFIPSPCRGIDCRDKVAVLKRPARTVLIEAGFYTSAADEAIGVAGWGDPIIKGISLYLMRHFGIYPQQPENKEDDEVIEFKCQIAGETGQGAHAGKQVEVWQAYGKGSDSVFLRINTGAEREIVAFFNRNDGSGVGPVTIGSGGHTGTKRPIWDALPGVNQTDEGFVTLHLLPEDSARFFGFVKA